MNGRLVKQLPKDEKRFVYGTLEKKSNRMTIVDGIVWQLFTVCRNGIVVCIIVVSWGHSSVRFSNLPLLVLDKPRKLRGDQAWGL